MVRHVRTFWRGRRKGIIASGTATKARKLRRRCRKAKVLKPRQRDVGEFLDLAGGRSLALAKTPAVVLLIGRLAVVPQKLIFIVRLPGALTYAPGFFAFAVARQNDWHAEGSFSRNNHAIAPLARFRTNASSSRRCSTSRRMSVSVGSAPSRSAWSRSIGMGVRHSKSQFLRISIDSEVYCA